MAEYRLFDPENPPEWLDPEWWRSSENCNHLAHPAGVHRARIYAAAELTVGLFMQDKVQSAVDMGAGDGALLEMIRNCGGDIVEACHGYEIIDDSVRYALDERCVRVESGNVVESMQLGHGLEWAELVICTEMLEHLADPHAWARTMAENAKWLIASSPHSETPERHEWDHAWAWDTTGYAEMLAAAGWEVIDHLTVEWSQIVVARSTVVS